MESLPASAYLAPTIAAAFVSSLATAIMNRNGRATLTAPAELGGLVESLFPEGGPFDPAEMWATLR